MKAMALWCVARERTLMPAAVRQGDCRPSAPTISAASIREPCPVTMRPAAASVSIVAA